MMTMFIMACMGVTVSCDKDDDNSDNEQLIVGTWVLDGLEVNGVDQSGYLPDIEITMNNGGSGIVTILGHDYTFTWKIDGDKLKSNNGNETFSFTIVKLTSTECNLKGKNISFPVVGTIEGEATVHLTKVNRTNNV